MRSNKKNNYLILWSILLASLLPQTIFAQKMVQYYKHFYNPDVEVFLLNFKPPNTIPLTIVQAQILRDDIFLNNWGEVLKSKIKTDTRSKFYEIDGMLMSAYIWSDSLYWQAEQDALVEQLQDYTPIDPYAPIQEKPIKKYKNEMGIRTISDLENYTLHWSNGHTKELKPYYISRSVIKPDVELVVDYVNITNEGLVSIFGFDKSYTYQIRISISFKRGELTKAIQAINWIADHVEIIGEIPVKTRNH